MIFNRLVLTVAVAALFAACSTAPFGYAGNRCTGRANQCQSACTGVENPSARAACIERCYAAEDRCLSSGFSGGDASMAEESLIGAKRSEAEKAAGYEAWRREKLKEQQESGDIDTPDE